MADKEGMERKVYLLPAELVERLRAYQVSQGIASEVEAARRLLDGALQMRDTVDDLLVKLKARFVQERDLRALNREVLAAHPLITRIEIDDASISFIMKTSESGRIDAMGRIFKGDGSGDYFSEVKEDGYIPRRKPQTEPVQPHTKASPSWEPSKGGDLDDEIPF